MYEEALTLDNDITRFDKLELNFKFKLKNTQDPFRDPKGKGNPKTHAFTAQTSTGWGVLDQLASYATEWCSWQHRTFAFTVCIFGSYARFIRWDVLAPWSQRGLTTKKILTYFPPSYGGLCT